jgi:NADH-quinone oxidoreductase subunit I
VTAPTAEQVEWVREHRPDDATLDAAAAVVAGDAPAPEPEQHELRPDQDRAAAERAAAHESNLDGRWTEREARA